MPATYSYRQIWHIAYPVLIGTLMEQLIGLTDTAFLGRVGEVELGAAAIGGIFFVAIFMIGLGFSTGAQILMARRNGEGNHMAVGHLFYHSLGFLLALAVVLFFLTRACSPWLLSHILQSEHVCAAALDYLNARVFGFFFAFTAIMFRSFYVATTNTRMLTANSLVLVASNIVFNYILIFGYCGLPALGIQGAAIGSVLAEAVSMVYFIVYTCVKLDSRRYGLNRLPRLRLNSLMPVLRLSVWTMIQDFISLSTWFIFFLSIEHLGETSLAVSNIIRNISSFPFMAIIALSSTCTSLVSNQIGRGDMDGVPVTISKTIRLTALLIAPLLLIASLVPEAVLRVFTDDSALIAAGIAPLYVLFASYIFTIPSQIYFHAVSGTGNTGRALVFEIISLTFYTAFVFIVVFSLRAPLYVCWCSEFVYGILSLALSYAYMRSDRWKHKRI